MNSKKEISQYYVDKLALEYELKNNTTNNSGLPLYQKILIIIFPFFIPIQAIIANRHISKGSQKKWKQHWQFVTIGFAFWTIVIILLAKFYLFKK